MLVRNFNWVAEETHTFTISSTYGSKGNMQVTFEDIPSLIGLLQQIQEELARQSKANLPIL